MTDSAEWKEDAYLAKGAYNRADVEGYTIDKDVSDEYTTTYVHNISKKPTVAFSGTNFTAPGSIPYKFERGADDVNADLYIVHGNEQDSPQFQQALELTKKVISKYGKENVHVTGHSLGGTKSAYVSSQTGLRGTGFAPGWTPMDIARHTPKYDLFDQQMNLTNILRGKTPSHQWDLHNYDAYIVPQDPITVSTLAQPGLRVHTIEKPEEVAQLKKDLGLSGSLSGIEMNPWMTAVEGGVIAKDLYELHKSENFLFERPQIRVRENTDIKVAIPAKTPVPPHAAPPPISGPHVPKRNRNPHTLARKRGGH